MVHPKHFMRGEVRGDLRRLRRILDLPLVLPNVRVPERAALLRAWYNEL